MKRLTCIAAAALLALNAPAAAQPATQGEEIVITGERLHEMVRGFIEEGTTTTPFDMTVLNELDRFHLALSAIEHVPGLKQRASEVVAELQGKLDAHYHYVRQYGEDMPEIRNWRWSR